MADVIPTDIVFGPLTNLEVAEITAAADHKWNEPPPTFTSLVARAVIEVGPADWTVVPGGFVALSLDALDGLDHLAPLLTALVDADVGYDATQSAIYDHDGRLVSRRKGMATPHEVSLNRSGGPIITDTEVLHILDNRLDLAQELRAHFGWDVPPLIAVPSEDGDI